MITTIRAPREADAEAVTELLRACDVVIFGAPDTDIDDVRAEWTAPGFDLARDAWLVETKKGTLHAYAYVSARAEGSDYDASIHVRPGDSIPSLAPPLLECIEARTLEKTKGAAVDLCFFTAEVEVEMRDLLERSGYASVRTFFRMLIDLGSAPPKKPSLPPGIEIRPLRIGQEDRDIHAALEESFAEHFRHTPRPFEEWWSLRTHHEKFDPSLFLLAREGDRVAGALTAYDHGDIGFIRELGVRASWRGRGLGSALLLHSFQCFRDRSQLRVALGVDAENESAIGLYRRAGMSVDSKHDLLRKRLCS
ncbi:MAG TPA: GNAT family N-acetyltransferase [Candidatus Angelobacter sp.]|nr:GNAT family N-acetyltransferase [Candidatus Angelobacter sp.]